MCKFFFNPKKECTVLLRFFVRKICHFCMTYETKKSAKNAAFFYKERKRTQRTLHSFIKNAKEHKNVALF